MSPQAEPIPPSHQAPFCPHCLHVTEAVHHLIECLQYDHARHELTNALGRNASSIQFLLSDSEAIQDLVLFVNTAQPPITSNLW